ncbi:MAG: RNA 2',3'-cyclic phosphodiesterase [candidate division Zixibacteria bacterium]|nr:RNA 2',3'-cyclic phosphodiesterase [candidate division Zixibacteria bacterium]
MRCFIAVKISAEQKDRIASIIDDFRREDVRVKWVKPENLHVTLKFLGEVDEHNLPDMFSALEKSLTSCKEFDFSLKGLGCFPNRRRPRVIWVGIDEGAPELKKLAGDIDRTMQEFGFKPEKRGFSAHLTIGRVKDPRGIEVLTNRFDDIKFVSDSCTIDEIVFYQSILKPEGPTYVPQKRIKLQVK